MYSTKQKGFTLIELSIVLVIIGLIVGGIVGGKSLVKSAKVNQFSSDFASYKSAMFLFRDQYDFLPGDLPNANEHWPDCADFGVYVCNGNGNNILHQNYEAYRGFEHLSRAEMIKNKHAFNGDASNRYAYAYKPPINGGSAFGLPLNVGTVMYNKLIGNTIGIFTTQNYIATADIKKIDSKLDDGFASKGHFIAYCSGCGTATRTSCVDATISAPSANYVLANNDTACYMLYNID